MPKPKKNGPSPKPKPLGPPPKKDELIAAIRRGLTASDVRVEAASSLPAAKLAAGKQKKCKKAYRRSARARDLRMATRGRLPNGVEVTARYYGGKWAGVMRVICPSDRSKDEVFEHLADGLFRLMEELDVKFWEWCALNPDRATGLRWGASVPPEPATEGASAADPTV